MSLGSANATLDGRIDWASTFAALVAANPAPAFPVGTMAYTTDLGTVRWNGANWQMNTSVDNLIANSGGVQAGATPLTASINRVATVGGAGYSVLLPASAPGMSLTVINAGANSTNVFPNAGGTGSEKVNALAANAAFALGAGKTVELVCCTAGQWHSVPLAP